MSKQRLNSEQLIDTFEQFKGNQFTSDQIIDIMQDFVRENHVAISNSSSGLYLTMKHILNKMIVIKGMQNEG